MSSAKGNAPARSWQPLFQRLSWSAVGLVRLRDVFVLVEVFMDTFGADGFRPIVRAAAISDGDRPRRREGAFVLDRDMHLKVLAPIIAVEDSRSACGAPILFRVALHPVLCVFVIKQPKP